MIFSTTVKISYIRQVVDFVLPLLLTDSSSDLKTGAFIIQINPSSATYRTSP